MADLNVNTDNEQVLISSILYFPGIRKELLAQIGNDDFLYEPHKHICKAARSISEKDLQITKDLILSVSKELGFNDVEYGYISDLEKAFPVGLTSDASTEHIRILKLDRFKKAFNEDKVKSIIKATTAPGFNIDELGKVLHDAYLSCVTFENSATGTMLLDMKEIVEKYRLEQLRREESEGIYTTGFKHLDNYLTEGFAPKKITVVAARPGCGKSTFVYELARRLANQGVHVMIFSLEMEDVDIMDKYLAAMTGIPIDNLVKCKDQLSEDDRAKIAYELERYERNPFLYISDKAGISLDNIFSTVKQKQLELGITYCVTMIDLFGQVSDFDSGKQLSQQYEHNLDITKRSTKLLGIHSVLVNQINRSAEKVPMAEGGQPETNGPGENPMGNPKFAIFKNRPAKSTLKNSGKWEEVADQIFLLFRGKYYDPSFEDDILEIDIAKQRKGRGNQKVYFELLPERGRILATKKLPYDMRGTTFAQQSQYTPTSMSPSMNPQFGIQKQPSAGAVAIEPVALLVG